MSGALWAEGITCKIRSHQTPKKSQQKAKLYYEHRYSSKSVKSKSLLTALLNLIIKPLGRAFGKEASPSCHAISAAYSTERRGTKKYLILTDKSLIHI